LEPPHPLYGPTNHQKKLCAKVLALQGAAAPKKWKKKDFFQITLLFFIFDDTSKNIEKSLQCAESKELKKNNTWCFL